MSKSILFCVSVVAVLASFGIANAQNVGSAQHYQPAVAQSYCVVYSGQQYDPGPVRTKPCSAGTVLQKCCCSAGKCQGCPQSCRAAKPCPKQAQQCPTKCSETMAQRPKTAAPCQNKVEQSAKVCVAQLECDSGNAVKRGEAMRALACEAGKRGSRDVAHHLRVKAEETVRALDRPREQQARLQHLHQEHAELCRAVKRQMQEAQELQQKVRHLAEQFRLAEQQMRKPKCQSNPSTELGEKSDLKAEGTECSSDLKAKYQAMEAKIVQRIRRK